MRVCVCVSAHALQSTLAISLLQLGKVSEAETLLRDSVEGCFRLYGPESPRTAEAVSAYWRMLQGQGQGYRKQAVAMRKRAMQQGCDVSECV